MEHTVKLRRLDRSTLKIIALIVMTVGHFFLFTLRELRCFGLGRPWSRILCYCAYAAPPIFFFFIAEGFRYTRSRQKYAARLLIFAIITQFAMNFYPDTGLDTEGLFSIGNVFFTLLFGFLDLWILHSGAKLPIRVLAVGALLMLSLLMDCEWKITGQLIILAYDFCKEKPWLNLGIIAALVLLDFGIGNRAMLLFLLLGAALVLFFYSGEKGKDTRLLKYGFYVFYPLHFLAINIVKSLLRT